MPGPPALVTIATRAPGGQRLGVEARGDVEHLVDRLGADDAGLPEQRIDGDVVCRQRRGVAARRARARLRAPRLDRDDRLLPADAPRQAREPARIAERFEIQQDHRVSRIGFPVLQQIVAGHVGLVADADERRQADVRVRPRAARMAMPSAPLCDDSAIVAGGGKTGENDAFSRTAGSVFSRPMQLGPIIRMP